MNAVLFWLVVLPLFLLGASGVLGLEGSLVCLLLMAFANGCIDYTTSTNN